MTEMTTTLKYDKMFLNLFISSVNKLMVLDLGMWHRWYGPKQACSDDVAILGLGLIYSRSNVILNA